MTDPLLTWCVLAQVSTVAESVRLGDALVSRNPNYVGRRADFEPVDLAALATATIRWKGCVGIDTLRAAQPLVREHVASPPESDLRMFAMDCGLPEFEINQPVYDDDGLLVGIVDGLCRDIGLVLEYDGDGHRTDRAQWRRDVGRYAALENLGYIVCRATGNDLGRDRDAFADRLRRAHERAQCRPWPPTS